MIEKRLIVQFIEFQNLKDNNKIQITNGNFHNLFQSFDFCLLLQNQDFSDFYSTGIRKSKIIVIDEYKEISGKTIYSTDFLIICYDNKLIIINQSLICFLFFIFRENKESKIYCLTQNCMSIIKEHFSQFEFSQNLYSNWLDQEITNFMNEFSIKNKTVLCFWRSIQRCISSYLILKSYNLCDFDRINSIQLFQTKNVEKVLKYNEIVRLKIIFISSSQIFLGYIIENERLCICKTICDSKLTEREKSNFLMLNHPLIPRYYGYINDISGEKSLLIEYIQGKTLNEINQIILSSKEKLCIIFEIMLVIQYLHFNGFIYRDLKPDNVIIDKNKTAVLIDFDRLIKCEKNNIDNNSTRDFCHCFIAPEILNEQSYSYPVDIYSLGLLIYFIVMEKEPSLNNNLQLPNYLSEFQSDFDLCISKNPSERPTISQLLWNFFDKYMRNTHFIQLLEYNISNGNESFIDGFSYYKIGFYFYHENMSKAIHYFSVGVKKNHINSMIILGKIYLNGDGVEKNLEKSMYYLTLASNLNDPIAQFLLGYIYDECIFDFGKAKYYYELSAKQNYVYGLVNLGKLYSTGVLGYIDYKSSIYYYTLAVNQGSELAQFNLAGIYYLKSSPFYDINKAIYYYTLAANQNFPNAQHILAQHYFMQYNEIQNIKKGLYYETLAAEQNFADAQYNLGKIYIEGKYVPQNVNKGMNFLQLAANQNHKYAKTYLGTIYFKGIYVKRDIKKTLYYCSDKSIPENNFMIGSIYLFGIDTPRDVDKAIYYFEIGAKQNYQYAQYYLGTIYLDKTDIHYDFKKGFHIMLLLAEQNFSLASFYIGRMYYTGNECIKQNRKKAIFYYECAANGNDSIAQFNLGSIYQSGIDVPQNMNKSLYYYSLSAAQNNPHAQYALGLLYSNGRIPRNISKAINYYLLASEQNVVLAQVNLALIYHEGIYVKRDIQRAIHFYKLASCFNNNVAKNNLGVIYRFGIEVKSNYYMAMEYFNEAIKQKNDILSKFNLAHIYFYEEVDKKLDDTTNLLLHLLNFDVNFFTIFFCLVLIKKYGSSINKIDHELDNINNNNILSNEKKKEILNTISQIYRPRIYKGFYNYLRNINFVYFKADGGYRTEIFKSSFKNDQQLNLMKKLDDNFYSGFNL